jgi:hypothetical protein
VCGSGCIDPGFLDLGTSCRWVVSFTPRPFTRGKWPWYPLKRRLGGSQSRFGRYGEEKILDPTGTRTPTPLYAGMDRTDVDSSNGKFLIDLKLSRDSSAGRATKTKTKLHGLSPRANYTDRATAACRRRDYQILRIEGATWSAWRISTAVFSVF